MGGAARNDGPAAGPPSAGSFRFLLGSSVTSALGGAVASVSINWLVYHYTGSTLDIAYVGLAGIVPVVALGLFAGVLADRYDRRKLMVTADTVRMVAMAVLAATLFFVRFSLFPVIATITIVYSFTAMFTPASQAILPRMIPANELESANGTLAASVQVALSLGSAGGGLIVVFLGAVVGLGINAITFAISGLLLFQIAASVGVIPHRENRPPNSMRRELGEGIQYMRSHPAVLEVTFGFLPGNFLYAMVLTFIVVYTAGVFGSDAAIYGYIVAALAAGAVIGSLMVPRIRARRFAGLLMGASVAGQGGAIALLVISRSMALSVVASAALGLSVGLINTVYYSTMQAIVPNEVLGRVLSIDSVGAFAAIPAGLLVGGYLAATHGILFTYSVAAIGLFANGLILLALPDVRGLRHEGNAPTRAPP